MNPSEQGQSIGAIVKGLLVFAALVIILVAAGAAFSNLVSSSFASAFYALSSLDAAIVVAMITGAISIVTVVGGGIISSRLTYQQKRDEYLRHHREGPYEQLIAIFFKVVSSSKLGEEYGQTEMLKDMTDFNQSLTLWGSSKAIQLWDEWRLMSVGKQPSPRELMLGMERVLIQLRRDMGQKRGLKQGDLLKIFINDVDEKILNKQ